MSKARFNIRTATLIDIPELNQLYQGTVLHINRKDYSTEEVEDWASCGNDLKHWAELINQLYFIVAENDELQIVGFASISHDGYLHSMFIHKDHQRQGIASLLYQNIEDFSYRNNIQSITSEVSITAKYFFEKQGFKVDEKQMR
ncbi:GNAT family N-acetyltransferase [Dysgonomonas massiliensis]|uniref:GNAT family N-acetyltransferase n=1 Tax=Dysgonomonas massiliensis TaxID=2040292 RepID=UPI000C790028|nr:GNAT family N-acetyltransferase [Dysgonomonas massiliensis]